MRTLQRSLFTIPILIIAAISAAGCNTVPYTGRSQFNMLSQSSEAQMGLQAYQEVLTTEKIINNGPQAEMVKRVAQRIATAADADAARRGAALGFDWQVSLIDSPQVNAWCMPGGKMGVYTGILPVAKTEAGLAVVMGHEVAHAVARHGGERVTQQLGAEVILQVIDLGLSKTSAATHQAVMAGLGAGAQVGVLLPFSRQHESEADHIGLLIMAEAGYDPREAPKLWERMSQLGGEKPPEFLSTHPSNETRIQQLNDWMDEALKLYNPHAAAQKPANNINNQKSGVAPPTVPKVSNPGQNAAPKTKK